MEEEKSCSKSAARSNPLSSNSSTCWWSWTGGSVRACPTLHSCTEAPFFPPWQLYSDSTDWTRSAPGNISTSVSLILGNISSEMSVWFWYIKRAQRFSTLCTRINITAPEVCGTKLCVAQGSTLLDIQWCQCCEDVVRVFAEKRCRLLTDETLNTTWHRAVFPRPATISLPPASRLPPHRRFCAVAMCPRQCAVSGKVKKQKLSVLLPSRCTCQRSGDWHFPVVLPLGGIIQGCAACCATAMRQQLPLVPLAWIYVFQTPSGVRNSAKKSCWYSLDALQKNPKAPYYSLLTK